MNLFKKYKKFFCGFISVAMLSASLTSSAFAFGTDITSSTPMPSAEPTVNVASETATPEPSATATEAPTVAPSATPGIVNMDMNVTATVYTTDDDSVYRVVYKTESTLPQITGFNFTTTYTDAQIQSVSFGENFQDNGNISKSITDDKSVKYKWSDGTAVSGSMVLVSAYVKSSKAITSTGISIDEFTATGSNSESIIITPKVTVVKGTNMPTLSEREQEAYDTLMALPTVESLTFYKSEKADELYDITLHYISSIDEAVDMYNNLPSGAKTNVNTALAISDLTIDNFLTLQKAANAMKDTYGIMELTQCFAGFEEGSGAMSYEYLKYTFENLSTNIPSAMKPATKAVPEYEAVISQLKDYNTKIQASLDSASDNTYENYQTKISALKSGYDMAKKYSTYTYSKAFITAITTITSNLYDDVDKNYTGSYKDYMLSDIKEISDEIESGSDIYKYLPTYEMSKYISIGKEWNVFITRNSILQDQEATVEVYAYKKNGELVQSQTGKFSKGDTKETVNLKSNKTLYNSGETITVKVYYVYNGISYSLGTQTIETLLVYNPAGGGATGGSTGGTGGSTGGTGTVYPTVAPETPKPTAAPNLADENPYTDIDNYDWAKEAIIGLTNAGIVNGMGDDEFNPAGNITREQFCKMVVQLFGVATSDSTTYFNDVDTTAWYAPYINAAVSAGYVQGQSDEYFGIGEVIMRQDMATILYRAANKSGDGVILEFTDVSQIADYAKDAVSEFVGLGIMNGYEDGSFKPRGSATRAEAAKVIWGVYGIR